MGIKANFNRQDLHKVLIKRMEIINNAILTRLRNLAEECVNTARKLDTYIDQTNNLRSSIGYVIYQNGSPIYSNFEQGGAGNKGSGSDGKAKGERLANEIAKKYSNGFVLVVVAGMNYALYVESKGYDVLTSTEHFAKQEISKMLSSLREDIKNMK